MDCLKNSKSGAQILLDYCSGALTPASSSELERHIETCPACRIAVQAQSEVWVALDGWKAPAVSTDFDARLNARIARELEAPGWRRWIRRLTQPAVPYSVWKPAALALACAVVAIGFLNEGHRADNPAPAAASAQIDSGSVDIEQVASALEELDLLMPSASAPATASPM